MTPLQRGLVRVASLSRQRATTPPNIGETNHRKDVVREAHDEGNTMGWTEMCQAIIEDRATNQQG